MQSISFSFVLFGFHRLWRRNKCVGIATSGAECNQPWNVGLYISCTSHDPSNASEVKKGRDEWRAVELEGQCISLLITCVRLHIRHSVMD